MITFNYVQSQNFYSVGSTPIKIQLDKEGSTLITGGNGSGKTSTIIEALTYGLFGRAYRKIKLSSVVNSINNKKCVVEVQFTKGSTVYKVVRGDKPKVFDILIDDKLIEKPAASKDYQTQLELILGMDYTLFSQVVVLNKSKFIPFMSLNTQDRRFVVEELLDISVLSAMSKELKDKLKDVNVQLKNNDHNIDLTNSNIQRLTQVIEVKKEAVQNAIAANKKAMSDAKSKNVKPDTSEINVNIDIQKEQTEQLEADLKEKMNNSKPVITEYKSIECDSIDLSPLNASINECNKTISTGSFKVTQSQKEVTFLESNSDCPVCKQNITDEFREERIKEQKTSIKAVNSLIEESKKNHSATTDKIKVIQANIDNKNRLKLNIDKLKQECMSIKGHISISKQKEVNFSNILAEMDKWEPVEPVQVVVPEGDCQAEETEKSTHETKLSEMNTERTSLYSKRQDINHLLTMLKDDGVKAQVVQEYVPVINERVNKYLLEMNLPLNFMLDNEFNETVKMPGKEKFGYYNFSDGQKTRIDLAMLLTWISIAREKNSIATNILVLDEILEALDLAGIEDFLRCFRTTFECIDLFVVSQRKDEICDNFKNQLHYELNNGFTELQVQ